METPLREIPDPNFFNLQSSEPNCERTPDAGEQLIELLMLEQARSKQRSKHVMAGAPAEVMADRNRGFSHIRFLP